MDPILKSISIIPRHYPGQKRRPVSCLYPDLAGGSSLDCVGNIMSLSQYSLLKNSLNFNVFL